MYKEIKITDWLSDNKIYKHATTFFAVAIHEIIIDNSLFKNFENKRKTEGLALTCHLHVGDMSNRVVLSDYVYTQDQEEYIEHFAKTTIDYIFNDDEIFEEIKSKREIFRNQYFDFLEYIKEFEFAWIKHFDELWTQEFGKIREDTPDFKSTEVVK